MACIGRDALLRVAKEGPIQQIRPIEIEGRVPACDRVWRITAKGQKIGQVTSAAWSPDHDCTVAIGMVKMTHWDPGTEIEIETHDGMAKGRVREAFWT